MNNKYNKTFISQFKDKDFYPKLLILVDKLYNLQNPKCGCVSKIPFLLIKNRKPIKETEIEIEKIIREFK